MTSAIQAYARALEAGDVAEALHWYPGMPDDQRRGLESFWKAGCTLKPRWAVTDIAISADAATARVTGSNTITASRNCPGDQRVNLRVSLRRSSAGWRLLALIK